LPFSSVPGPGPPRGYELSPRADQLVDDIPGSTTPDSPRHQRGWARLDADGNEITPEAEDEIDRARARSRVHALAQIRASTSSATPSLSPIELGAVRRETLIPITRTSTTHMWDDDERTARVHINTPRQTAISSLTANVNMVSSGTPASAHPVPQACLINRPRHSFVPDPLPMPLVDMITHPPTLHKSYLRTISVHKYASLAGR